MASSKKEKRPWSPNAYIKSHLRKIWRWSPSRKDCLKSKLCIQCGRKGTEARRLRADHIEPVVDPLHGFQTWDIYISRMFNGKLQALCDGCHKLKSKEENAQRRAVKKARKALGL